jgi:pimeloyl-ACP methyl ester carboxylesterase
MASTTPLPPPAFERAGLTLADLQPASAIRSDVNIGDVTLAVADMPATATEVGVAVLIPGFTSSLSTFFPLFQELADQGFRVVSFSQRGQPGSTGPDSPDGYSLQTLGRDVHLLADTLNLGRSIHLLGHSFGGVVGTEAVIQDPSRFESFTLWNSGAGSLGDELLGQRQALREHGIRALWVGNRLEMGEDPDADLRGELNVIEQFYHQRLFETNPAQLDAGFTHLHEHRDRSNELIAAGVRMLVSHGSLDDAWPIEQQRDFAAKVNADYWVIANAGHSAHADRPDVCARLLSAFWKN